MGKLLFFYTNLFLYCKKKKETQKRKKGRRKTSGTRIIILERDCRRKSISKVKTKKGFFPFFETLFSSFKEGSVTIFLFMHQKLRLAMWEKKCNCFLSQQFLILEENAQVCLVKAQLMSSHNSHNVFMNIHFCCGIMPRNISPYFIIQSQKIY